MTVPEFMSVLGTVQTGPVTKMFFGEKAASTFGGTADALFLFTFWLSVFFFVLLMGLMLYFAYKYRYRPGVAPMRTITHHTAMELAWSVGPLLILAVVFFWGFYGYINMLLAPADAMKVELTAQKWNWTMKYPGGIYSNEVTTIGARPVPVYAIPVNTPVELQMISTDVIHAFWVPAFRTKLDVFPNRYTNMWFEANRTGEFYVYCAEYCGTEHSEMAAVIKVMELEDYRAWLKLQERDPNKQPWERGAQYFMSRGCVTCHAIEDGKRIKGPWWTNVYGYERRFTDGTTQIVDENYLRESILTPAVKIVEGYKNEMTPYAGVLNEDQISDIIAYFKHLSDRGGGGGVPNDADAGADDAGTEDEGQ